MLDQLFKFPLSAAIAAAMGGTPCDAAGDGILASSQQASIQQHARGTQGVVQPEIAGELTVNRLPEAMEFDSINSEGQQIFTGQSTDGGRTANISMTSGGEIVGIETELALSDLPAPVKRTADIETLGYPSRRAILRQVPGNVSYLIFARATSRAKVLEVSPVGRVLQQRFEVISAV
jgi:hypothetical protein